MTNHNQQEHHHQDDEDEQQVIVAGAGICGSWATLQLARRGAHVLLLEQVDQYNNDSVTFENCLFQDSHFHATPNSPVLYLKS